MSRPDKNAVFDILEPFHDALCQSVQRSWTIWTSNQGVFNAPISKRARANVFWDVVTDTLKTALYPEPDVYIVERNQSCIFVFKESVQLRIKKGDTQGLSRNYPTQTAMKFHDHEADDLYGVPVKVELIYTLDSTETQLRSIEIVARDRNSVLWSYSLSAVVETAVVEFPERRTEKSAPAPLFRVKGRDDRDSKREKEEKK